MNLPKTEKEFNKLSPALQGALWPVCKFCGHIAQEHDTHKSEPKTHSCSHVGKGQCEHCGQWSDKAKCPCLGYDGPENVEELVEYLNNAAQWQLEVK